MDEQQRNRFRQLVASEDCESRARVIRDRQRRGELGLEMVRLAAYCGHRASRLVLGNGPHGWLAEEPISSTSLGPDMLPFERWLVGLTRWPLRLAWAVVDVAQSLLSRWEYENLLCPTGRDPTRTWAGEISGSCTRCGFARRYHLDADPGLRLMINETRIRLEGMEAYGMPELHSPFFPNGLPTWAPRMCSPSGLSTKLHEASLYSSERHVRETACESLIRGSGVDD